MCFLLNPINNFNMRITNTSTHPRPVPFPHKHTHFFPNNFWILSHLGLFVNSHELETSLYCIFNNK